MKVFNIYVDELKKFNGSDKIKIGAVFPHALWLYYGTETYASRAAREAAAIPTNRATIIRTDAMVMAEDVS